MYLQASKASPIKRKVVLLNGRQLVLLNIVIKYRLAIDINVKVCFMSSGEINRALSAVFPTATTTDDIGCYIRKPVDIDDLIRHIEAELRQIGNQEPIN